MNKSHLTYILIAAFASGCEKDTIKPDTGDEKPKVWECLLSAEDENTSSNQIGCSSDFDILAAAPLDASIPGARSVKTVLDRLDDNQLYFQNSNLYPIHWDFASANLSGNGLPIVPDLSTFNTSEYFSPDRRFILGAVTYYEEPDVWAYEISPYDTASAEMITLAFNRIRDNAYFGEDLLFHPTAEAVETVAADLSEDIPIITTDELFEGINYQPLNLATSMGRLGFYTSAELEESYLDFREIIVLQAVPNDIGVVSGIITEQFQTPLSHINVLSQNRGTPNMGLRGAFESEELRALEGKWVELSVGAFEYTIREVTQAEADEWWESHKPEPLEPTPMDITNTVIVATQDLLDLSTTGLEEAIAANVPIYGGKATHYGALTQIDDLPVPTGFAIPVFYYYDHLDSQGLWPTIEDLLIDPDFAGDPVVRSQRLAELRLAIEQAPMNPTVLQFIEDKIISGYEDWTYPMTRFRFRSSTNAEDVSGFNGAGLYTSVTGDPRDDALPVEDAIKTVWASVWSDRAFAEREYYSIDHTIIGMAVLCHRSFPYEDANGVAITANIFDSLGLEPGFYVNAQVGDVSVVKPQAGVTSDQYIHYYEQPGQPIVYLAHSSLVDSGETVLSNSEVNELGIALKAIHQYFAQVYMSPGVFYGMDVEFKFDSFEHGRSELTIKQARPYPGWGGVQ
jgi:hypothetical protein